MSAMDSSRAPAESAEAAPVQVVSPGLFEAAADQEATAEAALAAAAPAVERADVTQLSTLHGSVQPAMCALLLSLADNKYLLGRRYAEWCTGAPVLESAVAAAAMAQDELGHARSFYPVLRGFPWAGTVGQMEERGWQTRPASAVASLTERFGSWAEFISANLLVDTAMTVLFESAQDTSYEPLRQRARKIVQEETAHWVHAEGWLRRLAGATDVLPQSLGRFWDDAFTWYGPDDDPVLSDLADAGLLAAGPAGLRARLRARVEPLLAALPATAGLVADLAARPLPWDRWDAQARRLR